MDDHDGFQIMRATAKFDPMSLRRESCAGLNLSRLWLQLPVPYICIIPHGVQPSPSYRSAGSASYGLPVCSTPDKVQRGNDERARCKHFTPPEALIRSE
jgi:hypothetical protein